MRFFHKRRQSIAWGAVFCRLRGRGGGRAKPFSCVGGEAPHARVRVSEPAAPPQPARKKHNKKPLPEDKGSGAEKEIRTLDDVPAIHDFQSCALDQLSHLCNVQEI